MSRAKNNNVKSPLAGFKNRLGLVVCLLGLYGAGLTARLVYLQVVQHEQLLAEAEKQYVEKIEINTGRGKIYDRNHNPLATNVDVESVYLNPKEVTDKKQALRQLTHSLDLSPETVQRKLDSRRHFVWLKRKIALTEAARLKDKGIPGVGFIRESRRFYPKRALAASTLGFVGLDNQGLEGVEHYFDDLLKGSTRKTYVERDARGRPLLDAEEGVLAPSPSHDLELTLDETIQFHTETVLTRQIEQYNARGGVAIVMEPRSGDILSMATYPPFNPNRYSAASPEAWRNPAVSHAYEPGSIFKPIVAAAAVEEGTASPQDIFFCENGEFRIGKATIGEAANHRFGWLSLSKIIAHSSNIGAIKVAQTLGDRRFFDYIKRFGFGTRSGVSLPGESSGMLRSVENWSGLSLASISFGHEISVTPLQMVTAMAAIANGGELVKPRLARGVWKDGKQVTHYPPQVVRRVISPTTSRKMIGMLKEVVRKGTGKKAAVKGFEVAGKTGTAQKIDPETHHYSSDNYIASFIGFVPAESPRLVILVMIDEPRDKYWGGEVAAPVFSEIARETLRYLNVPPQGERVFVLDRA
ncbi:MAG: penicillin-binding protein 2 [Nitrospina sp.]|nr:penicillin-binding protein 2 [Nitrospina sp.]